MIKENDLPGLRPPLLKTGGEFPGFKSLPIAIEIGDLGVSKALVFFALLFISFNLFAQYPPKPEPPRLVNDLAGVLSPGEQQNLEIKLRRYNDSTSTQVAIVTLHSIGNNDISEYATELGDKWGIGQKGKDNGILILAAMDDHKIFIATGRGVEARVPDMLARRICDAYITPNFKQQKYYDGFDQATTALFKLLTGEFKATDIPEGQKKRRSAPFPFWLPFFLIFLLISIVINIINRIRGGAGYTSTGGYMGGGFFGGGFGGGGGGGGGSDFGGFGGGSFGGGGSGGDW